MLFEKKLFENKTVVVDGNEYVNCTFRNVVLVFRGTTAVSMKGCELFDTNWELQGPALRTVRFLGEHRKDGHRDFVDSMIKRIRQNRFD
jgi:hypothetical protein